MTSFRKQVMYLFTTAIIGLTAGLAAVGFRFGTNWVFQNGIVAASQLPLWIFALIAFFLISAGALITGWLMQRFAPDAPGSGIPQVKLAYNERKFDFTWKLLFVKFFGGLISIGTGSSLGREGPTIHIGAVIASKVASFAKESQEAKANAICAGAAAGLAVAFNSPLAGVTLVLEEIAEGHNMEHYAGRCLLASALSVSMVYLFTGDAAALPLKEHLPMKEKIFWLAPFVAIFAGLMGVFFQGMTLKLRKWFKNSHFPLWLRPSIGAIIAAVFCLVAFGLTSRLGAFGLGESDLHAALQNQILWKAAAWLLAAKLLATIFCYGAGGCGGIFAPLIFFGGMAGVVSYGVLGYWLPFDLQDQTVFSLIGMTACLGAVVRAPLTSILIVLEMTRQIHILPALMVAAVIGGFINALFFRGNFYNESLRQDKIESRSQF